MTELHCKNCNRFLCKVSFGEIEIKCSSCKAINKIRIDSHKQLLTAKPEETSISS